MPADKSGRIVTGLPPSVEERSGHDQVPSTLLGSIPSAGSLAYADILEKRKFALSPGQRSETFEAPPADDRTGSNQVVSPEIKGTPWKAICHLTMIYESGQRAIGTGFLVGERTVITAGHCVFLPSFGQAIRVTVVPAREGNDAPFGWNEATLVDFSRDWQNTNERDPDPQHDFGAVFLSTPTLHQRVRHTLSTAAFADADVRGIRVANVAGYPGRRPIKMERDHGPLVIDDTRPLDPRILYHLLETHEGQSGGPIIHYNAATTTVTVFGIHTYGDAANNIARRIDPELAGIINRWVATPQPFMAGAPLS